MSGTRPVCPICCSNFENKSNLNAHIRAIHNSEQFVDGYECPFPGCSKIYVQRRNVKPHFMTNHKQTENDWNAASKEVKATKIRNKRNFKFEAIFQNNCGN